MRDEGHLGPSSSVADDVRVELKELTAMNELRPLEEVQRVVWGIDDLEVVPASLMRAAVHAGGVVVGAVVDGRTIGFAFGFTAPPHGLGMEGVGMHSHMAAVLPEYRSLGVGRKLKRYQAEWCRAHGLSWMTWTFDPLREGNARFNLAVLGARCHEYIVDFYGAMPGTLGGGIESDRLLALWSLLDPKDSAAGSRDAGARQGVRETGETWLLPVAAEPAPASDPEVEAALGSGRRLRVATAPASADVFSRPELAMAWRRAHRRTLGRALASGWAVTGFEGGAYVLERSRTAAGGGLDVGSGAAPAPTTEGGSQAVAQEM